MEHVPAYFNRLGEHVEQRWTARGRRSDQLADIASDALRNIPLPFELTPEAVLGLLAAGSEMPKQRASSDPFGQPPAVMYRGTDLEIQAITWMDGSTSTHQHGFDGAFRVVHGSSLHVRYSFDEHESLADRHLVVGRLAMIEPEILSPGSVRGIVSGPDFIHALFHLERPSMTIVVRNGSSGHPYPQYDYRLPGLGFDVLSTDDRLRMRLRGLHSLYRLDRGQAALVARQVIASEDLWTAFRVCDDWALTYGETPELAELVDTLARRALVFRELLPPMYAEEVRRGRLLARRGFLREPRHRLFLALIVNLPNRSSIDSVLEQLFPDEDPSLLIMDQIEELASPRYRGISGLSIGADDMAALRSQIENHRHIDVMDVVASTWKPPSLFESLFT